MKMSIRTKFLASCIFLVVLTTISISTAYYFLAKRDKQRESQERIQIAFDIILDDVEDRLNTSLERVREFVSDDILRVTTSSYMQDDGRIQSISFISTTLARAADELKRFGQVNSAHRVMLYGANNRLLAAYQRHDKHDAVGVYVVLQDGTDAFLPMDDPAQLTSMLLDRQAVPDTAGLEGISPFYKAELPTTLSANLFTERKQLGIRITAPISHQEHLTGVLLVDIAYTQSVVERYASLSKTAVNFFVGNQLSVGTLRTQTNLELESVEQMVLCESILKQDKEIDVFPFTLNNQDYYQGQCLLKNVRGTTGAITVSLSQNIEKQAIKEVLIAVLTISGIALGVAVSLAYLFSHEAIRAIQNIVSVIGSIAEGDLRKNAVAMTRDEFGMLVARLNQMIEHLRTMVGQVQRSGIQVTSSATELAATAKQQEVTVKTQVESTNMVVESVKEISNVTSNLVETMQRVVAMSQETAEFASSGQLDLARMQEAMEHMEEASRSISNRLSAINEKAENITAVVITITKVADQTNLLSLNAAIEAEKAGEYGRGFTVVAREIRRLADQTAVATLDIEQMVKEMQSAVSAGVMEMDKFIAEVRHSAEDVERISLQLTRIIEQVQALSPRFEDVNEAMGHQSDHAREIDTAMTNLSEEMQQTMESLRESFLAIGQLNEAARGLQEEVSRFKVS
jgi:methyl-accepting chemotaxis protein